MEVLFAILVVACGVLGYLLFSLQRQVDNLDASLQDLKGRYATFLRNLRTMVDETSPPAPTPISQDIGITMRLGKGIHQ